MWRTEEAWNLDPYGTCGSEPPQHGFNLACEDLWHIRAICMECDLIYYAVGRNQDELERQCAQDRINHYEYHLLEGEVR